MVPVDPGIAVVCDGCEKPMHVSCLGLLREESACVIRAQRKSVQINILCADCNGNFKVSLFHHCVNSNAFVELISVSVKVAVKKESEILQGEIVSLNQKVESLKSSNIDLVRLLTNGVDVGNHCNNVHSASYASKVGVDKKIVVKSKNSSQSVLQTHSDVLKNVNLIDEEILVTKVKSVANGGFLH